jgi:hypothetical protein
MRSIGGTAEVSNWSGFTAPEPETPLGRLGGVVVAGGTITAAGAGDVVVPFGNGVAVGVAPGLGVEVGCAVAPGLGVEVGCAVAVGLGVEVGCGVAVGLGVAVGCGVAVGFGVAVGCGVGVGDPFAVTVSVVEPDEAAKFSSPA